MTSGLEGNLRLMLESIMKVKPSQDLLVVAENYSRSRAIAGLATDVASSLGIRSALAISDRGERVGSEPPRPIAAAMKQANFILDICEKTHIAHTTARKEASAAGAKFYGLVVDIPEEELARPISLEDLNKVKKVTDALAVLMTKAKSARITTPYGTDLTMSLDGRKALSIHPLADGPMGGPPQFGESAISPVEGSTEGTLVVDASIRGWGVPTYLFRKPIRMEIRKGKIVHDSISSDAAEQAERLKKATSLDETASNCAAELGIATSHVPSENLRGDFVGDFSRIGTFHIAFGRNDDIGGKTHSVVHADMLMTGGTIILDGTPVLKDGVLRV